MIVRLKFGLSRAWWSLPRTALSNPARGDFLYQFTTTMSAGDGGVLSVNFVVPDAAVARGAVLPSDVTSYIGPALIDEPTVPFLFRYA